MQVAKKKKETIFFFLKGNSLVIQWLGPHAFTTEGLGSISGWGTKMLQVEQEKEEEELSSSEAE